MNSKARDSRDSAVRDPCRRYHLIISLSPSLTPPRCARHTDVTLQELLQTLTPLASSLEVLDLSGSKLGGNIPANITVFAKLKTLNMSGMDLEGRSSLSVPSGSVFATEKMLCCSGPPLPEALKLLAPLANIEELSLSGNKLGGTITADVAVFKKLKKLDLRRMSLGGTIGSTRPERFDRLD